MGLRGLLDLLFLFEALALDLTNRTLLRSQRCPVRDLLDAQEDFVDAQNALTNALVNYRVSELELQRDMGLLSVDEKGLWIEYAPEQGEKEDGSDDEQQQ